MYPETNIREPLFIVFRRGAWRIGLRRTTRVSIFFFMLALAFDSISSRIGIFEQNSLLLLTMVPFAAVIYSIYPRSVILDDNSISVRKYGDTQRYEIGGENNPILLLRSIGSGLHHFALISPTVSVRLLEIAPVFECVIAECDIPKLSDWQNGMPDVDIPWENAG